MIRFGVVIFLLLGVSTVFGQDHSLESVLLDYDQWERGNPDLKKIERLDSIIDLCVLKKDRESKADALRRKGLVYTSMGYLDSALNSYLQSLLIQEKTGNKVGMTSTYNNIAAIYYHLGQFEKSLHSFLETGALSEELSKSDPYYADLGIVAYYNVAQVYFEMDSFSLAKSYLNKVYKLQTSVGKEPEGYERHFEGLLLNEAGEYVEAIEKFTMALDLFKQEKDYESITQTIHNIGLSYKGLKEWTSARIHLEMALDSALSIQVPYLISEVAGDLETYYLELGDTMNAFHYLALSKRFNDSLLNEAGVKALIEAEQKYENEAKKREIKVQKETLRQRYVLIFALLALLIALVAAFYFYRRVAVQKEKLAEAKLMEQSAKIDELFRKQEISSLSAQMNGQNEERQRISRELHDRLGSLLSTIKLQFSHFEGRLKNIEDEFKTSYSNMLGMLDKAYDEVRRISHDLSSGTLEKFGLKGAVNELITAVTEVSPVEIKFLDNHTDPAKYAHLNEPVYRIIQELLSNSLKHALAKEISMQLHINNGIFYFSYEDDGKGMRLKALESSKGIGMKNIENRVAVLNGTMSLDSTPGHGFTFMMEVPL